MALLLKADGDHQSIQPAHGRAFTAHELHTYVGGYFEVVAAPSVDGQPFYLVLNDDGKRQPLPRNFVATILFHTAGGSFTDWIAGDVVYCTRADLGEDDDADPDDR